MYSKKSLQILFDFKYQLYSSASYQYNEAPEDKKRREQSIEAFKEAAKKRELTRFKAEFKYLFREYSEIIKTSIDQKTNNDVLTTMIRKMSPDYKKDSTSLGLDNRYTHHLNEDVMAFFDEDTSPDVFELYGDLGEKEEKKTKDKPSFLARMSNSARRFYQNKQWQYWYWPNLYYGKRSLRLIPFLLSELIASVMYICGFSVMIAFMISYLTANLPFSPVILIYSLVGGLMTGFAFTAPKTKLEIFLLLLLAAGMMALFIFCPPLSVGVILGLSLSVVHNILLTSAFAAGCLVVSKGIKVMIKPETNNDIDALFSGSNNTRPAKFELVGIPTQASSNEALDACYRKIKAHAPSPTNPSASFSTHHDDDDEEEGEAEGLKGPTSGRP